ncbi:MAG: PBSX family phage terminase large subunit [Clostridium sp.]|uniref:PBSX family phage terminase large subunit n=1 Tax=Clostridium sp. TaxID=1506 RepID=UPI003F2AB189
MIRLSVEKFKISKKCFNRTYLNELQNYKKRYNVFYGGAGSGKSHFVVQKMLFKYLKYGNRKCLVVRKVSNTLRESIFALFKSVLGDWKLYEQCKVNKTDMTIELPNGSSFIFKGIDDPEKIKSIANIDDIVVEECTEVDEFDFDQLDLRLRSQNGLLQIHCMFNPVSKANWVYKRWFKDGFDKEDTVVLHTTYEDNEFLPQSYVDALLKMRKTNPVYFKIYALGEFATLDKLVYTNWVEEVFEYKEILKTNKNAKAIFGLDFGYTNDPTAFIAAVIDEVEKEIWIFDEFQMKGLTNKDIAEKVIEMGYRKEIITCDSAEPKSIDELKLNGLDRVRPAIKGKDSILNGIQVIQQYRVHVLYSCTYIIEELKNYTWIKDKVTGEYINKPIDKYNHGLDAFRYAVNTELKGALAVVTILDRRLLGI